MFPDSCSVYVLDPVHKHDATQIFDKSDVYKATTAVWKCVNAGMVMWF